MSGRRRTLLALTAVAGTTALAVALTTTTPGERVTVMLDDAAGLRKNSDVKVGGVAVGKVKSLELTEGDDARAVLELSADAGEIGERSRAFVRSANVFGEKFIELESDGGSDRPGGDVVIPKSRSAAPVELDDVVDVFDSETRLKLSVLINESGWALAGRSEDFNALIGELPGSLHQARRLIAELGSDNKAIADVLERSDRILAAIAGERGELGRLVGEAAAALEGFASRHADLGAAVREGAPTLRELESTLTRIEQLAEPLGPAASLLRASAGPLQRVLERTRPFERAARGALDGAIETAPALSELARGVTPMLERANPVARRLDAFAGALDPVSKTIDGSAADVLGTLEGWARATAGRDQLGHIFRGHFVLTEQTITAILRALDEPAGAGTQRRGAGADRREGPTPGGESQAGAPEESQAGASEVGGDRAEATERPEDLSALLDFVLGP